MYLIPTTYANIDKCLVGKKIKIMFSWISLIWKNKTSISKYAGLSQFMIYDSNPLKKCSFLSRQNKVMSQKICIMRKNESKDTYGGGMHSFFFLPLTNNYSLLWYQQPISLSYTFSVSEKKIYNSMVECQFVWTVHNHYIESVLQ